MAKPTDPKGPNIWEVVETIVESFKVLALWEV